jgi:putative DNA primase/helicase
MGAEQVASIAYRRKPNPEPEESRPPEFSDDALALDFAARHHSDLRYVAAFGKWLVYDGARWADDGTLKAYDLVRARCRETAAACDQPKNGSAIASAKTIAAVERLARSDRRLAATVEQWDSDPWLLNTPDGVVDLGTGELGRHIPEEYHTRMTAVSPGGDCPLFMEFLDRITDRDTELQAFMARMFGYALTGSTNEHALFYCHGVGANGKSVLLNTISAILGDYAQSAPIETFTESAFERHPTELAGLRGARLVTAIETEQGRRWAEARIKALTGGDKISARFMRQDFFEFTPSFKLIVAGNHKPGLRSVDEAIRRRFHLIPFAITIPAGERDPDLGEKLKDEWPGILQWLIDGCVEWQKNGLGAPKVVTDATNAYLESEDALAAWLCERCLRDPQAWERSSELFTDWKTWAERSGEPAGTLRAFSQNLESRGLVWERRRTGRGFQGLQLTPQMTGDYR